MKPHRTAEYGGYSNKGEWDVSDNNIRLYRPCLQIQAACRLMSEGIPRRDYLAGFVLAIGKYAWYNAHNRIIMGK